MNYLKKKYITLITFIKDFLIIYLLYNLNFYNSFGNNPNQNVVLCLVTFWLISNYVFGYYSEDNNSKNYINSKIIGLILITVASNLIYFTINFMTEGYKIDLQSLIFFIYLTLQISFLILATEAIKDYFFSKAKKLRQTWLVQSNKKKFTLLRNLLNNSNLKNISLVHIEKDIKEYKEYNYDGIIIENNFINKKELKTIREQRENGIAIKTLLNWSNDFLQICPSEFLLNNDIFYFNNCNLVNSIQFRIKRLGDIFISFLILLLLSPLMVFLSITILLIDGKPIFYSQIRTGLKTIHIKIFKFRSMINGAEENGPQWSKNNDKRITRLGKFLRKYRLDELPQLISVIKGDMSLIGPRPERPQIDSKLKDEIIYYELRNFIKPGISGWAQVNYPYGASVKDAKNKLNYDLYYIRNYSIILDIIILFKTLKIVFNGKGYKPSK